MKEILLNETFIILLSVLLLAVLEAIAITKNSSNKQIASPLIQSLRNRNSYFSLDAFLTTASLLPIKNYFIGLFTLGLPIWLYSLIQKNLDFNFLSKVPWPFLRLMIALLVLDFICYLRHYFIHSSNILWEFHKVHHTPDKLNLLMHWREHPLTAAFKKVFLLPVAALLGLETGEFAIVFLIREIWVLTHHSSLNIKIGILEKVLCTPQYHRLHHLKETGPLKFRNLGNLFTFWDHLFGTYEPQRLEFNIGLGEADQQNGSTIIKALINPYSKIITKLKGIK